MSLLMQALKKAEHAKKQIAPATEETTKTAPSLPETEFPTLDGNMPPLEVKQESDFIEPRFQPQPEMQLTLTEPEPPAIVTNQPPPAHIEPRLDTPMSLQAQPEPELTRQVSEPVVEKINIEEQKLAAKNNAEKIKQSQQLAQSVFAAKRRDRSKRTAVLGGVALIILLIAGAGFYYWQDALQDIGPAGVPAMPVKQALHVPVQPNPVPTSATESAASSNEAMKAKIADMSHEPAEKTQQHSELAHSDTASLKPAVVPDSNKPQSEQTVLVAAADQIHINKSTVTSPVNSPLMQAYQLFSAGDINAAQSLYKSVLHNDPDNRDAMLGLAAVALKQKQPERAAALYSTLLDLNPADPDAIAGLISLKRGDPDQSESELKRVLAQNPQSGANLFELGNLYVRQSRWSEAEEVYFHAYETSPGNADYAFNLAISLDRLGQVRLALDYYQRALALAKNVPGNFDLNTAQNRIVQLQQVANQ